jgi:predicted metal-binding membrane protein
VSSLPRRDRIAVLTGLGGVTLLAWAYLLSIGGMGSGMPGMRPWSALDFWLVFLMWAVMMVGMMVPSAAPMALVYAAVARKARAQGTPLAPTAVFVAGYVVVWTLFSAAATLAQWGLERAALLSPMLVATSPLLGGALLVGSGVYQLTPAKNACLRHCRAPAHFMAERWRPGPRGALRMGLEHGAWCLGCCWVLMGLLFFGGVMNLLWVAAIALFVLVEKVLPGGERAARWAGGALVALGLVVMARG